MAWSRGPETLRAIFPPRSEGVSERATEYSTSCLPGTRGQRTCAGTSNRCSTSTLPQPTRRFGMPPSSSYGRSRDSASRPGPTRPRSIAPSRRWPRWPDTFWTRSSPTRNPGTVRSRLRVPAREPPNDSGRRDRSNFHIRQIVAGSASFGRQLLAHRKTCLTCPGQ